MVGHQAIGPDVHMASARMLAQQIATDILVAFLEEDGFAPVAPLCDVVRQAGNDDAGHAGHGTSMGALQKNPRQDDPLRQRANCTGLSATFLPATIRVIYFMSLLYSTGRVSRPVTAKERRSEVIRRIVKKALAAEALREELQGQVGEMRRPSKAK
jgi:hypothetical protein